MTIYRWIGKRTLDITAASVAVLILSPLLAAVTIAVRISMGSPILFRQQRVGKYGRHFCLIKFRTMRLNSEELGTVTVQGDLRITQLGSFLRKFKIDELPQLFNILKGDMSIVGPRPDVPEMIEMLTGKDRIVLSERPALTGPASVIYAEEERLLARHHDPVLYNQAIFRRKIRINKAYVNNVRLCADLYWIYRTALCVVAKKGSR